jgi:Carboxypeptidase regulatory-like domain/TonB dependent receptor-like, beta-barrel/TonB-dependent Receptor Plug Domain
MRRATVEEHKTSLRRFRMGKGNSTRAATILAVALLSSLLFGASAYAQVVGATLSGTVSDPSGAAIPRAQISIRNTDTGVTTSITADSSGLYSAPNLLPGTYNVTVTAPGFATQIESNITLAVGQQQSLNITLKVGQATQKIEVTGAAPAVQLTTSTISAQVNSTTVRELPLNGRDWTQLAALQPGVAKIETQMSYDTSARGNRGFGAEYTISGGRTTFNNYRIDGISVVDYANAAPGDVLGIVLGVDAIQEFSVLTGGFSAEYGRSAGGVVNAISRSGTNTLHGDAYEFLRNSSLDSNDFFNTGAGQPKPPFRRNQFGGSAGGPIIKDKTFIFGDYEGLRQSKGIPTNITVPSDAARAGDLVSGPVTLNPYSEALLALYPHANSAVSGDTGRFIFSGVQVVPENFFTARVDHKISDKDSLFGTYLIDDANYTQPDKDNLVLTVSHTRRQTIALEETHVFGSSLVNAARAGFNREYVLNQFTPTAVNPAGADLSLGSMQDQSAPRLTVSGISEEFGGINSGSHYLHVWNSYQFYDDVNWTHGAHSLKFGGGVEREQYNPIAFQNPGGRWKFSSLANFLTGVPKSFEAGFPQTVTPREMRQTIFGGYIQDDWRFRPNLTLNLGLRYEMATVVNDAQGKITSLVSIFEPSANTTADADLRCGIHYTAPVTPQPGTTCDSVGAYYQNPTLRNFEPRVGFAWDPFRDGKTSVRGGFGIFDVLPLPGYFLLQQNQSAPFMIFKSASGDAVAGGFSAGNGQTILTNSTASRLAASTIEPDPHRSYLMQWNLTLQRQLNPNLTLTLGYIGSHGVHLLMRGDDGNMTMPTLTSAGYLFPCGFVSSTDPSCTPGFTGGALGVGGATSARFNQALGVIRYIYWNTSSNYHGLNVNLQKRFSHGFQGQFSYTYAKSLDDDSQTIAGDSFGNGINSPMWFLPKAYYGPSDFDVRHTMTINGLWDVPTPKSLQGVANTVLGGWELGGIFAFNTGVPTTPIISDDPLGLGNSGADQHGLPNRVAGCNPVNPNWKADNLTYINVNCFTLPTAPASASFASQCGDFPGAATPAPAGQVYCANLLGNSTRNSIHGPSLANLDLSILKNFPVKRISEAFNIQFRAEFFNILNRANFVPPQPLSGDGNAAIFQSDGSPTGGSSGQMTQYATLTPSREIQFALKVIW